MNKFPVPRLIGALVTSTVMGTLASVALMAVWLGVSSQPQQATNASLTKMTATYPILNVHKSAKLVSERVLTHQQQVQD